ncbi:MAG: hypothetical protein U0793_00730 [Gemmataceae bacterium]
MRASSLVLLFLVGSTVRAEHFAVELKVETNGAAKTATGETLAPGVKAKDRAVVVGKAGAKVTVHWTLTNVSKAAAKNVVVHFFCVKEEMLNQPRVPKLTEDVVAESAVSVDFNPKDRTKGELTFVIDREGAYLIKVETIGAAGGTEDHEHFAQLDLSIPKAK